MVEKLSASKRYSDGLLAGEIARLQLNKENTIDHDADIAYLNTVLSTLVHRITFCTNEVQTNSGSIDFLLGNPGMVVAHRMNQASFARLMVTIREPTGAIKPNYRFYLRYSASFSLTVGDYIEIGDGGSDVSVTIGTTGDWQVADSGWVQASTFGGDFLYLAIQALDLSASSAPCDIGAVTVLLSDSDG